MSCIQTTNYKPSLGPPVRVPHKKHAPINASFYNPKRLHNYNHARIFYTSSSFKRLTPINSLSGAGGASNNNNNAFSMESLRKAMEGIKKEKSLQDSLREKLQLDFGGNIGGGGANRRPPRGGGGGNEEPFNFGDYLDEVFQVFMATLGLVSVYIYVIRGEELLLLARDYLKYLIWGRKTLRLRRAISKFDDFKSSIAQKLIVNSRISEGFGGGSRKSRNQIELAMREMEEKGIDNVDFDNLGMVLKRKGEESDDESDFED